MWTNWRLGSWIPKAMRKAPEKLQDFDMTPETWQEMWEDTEALNRLRFVWEDE